MENLKKIRLDQVDSWVILGRFMLKQNKGEIHLIFMQDKIPISQQNKMSFKCKQLQSAGSTHVTAFYSSSSCQNGAEPSFFDDFAQKIKNSICLILQACDAENLHKSTKFLAYSIFTRYLESQRISSQEELLILILCSLRLSCKFNEAPPKATIFDTEHYTLSLLPTRSMGQILQYELDLFRKLGFRINIKSPYQFLDDLYREKSLSIGFYNSVSTFIDFSLTLVQLLPYAAEEIVAGCLWALKASRKVENKKILRMVQQICGRVKKANQTGYIILQSWQSFMNELQSENTQPQNR